MSGNNSNALTLIKDLKPGMNGINLQIIVLEIPRPTTTKDNQVWCGIDYKCVVLKTHFRKSGQ